MSSDEAIARIMRETGQDEMQAHYTLRSRKAVQEALRNKRPSR